jgi:glycosyltransferase involved in cell wall biosynthesis
MASEYYGVESNRFLAMPLTPSQFLSEGNSVNAKEVLIKYRLEANYLFYPAQFWGHKNHIRILQALIILRNENGWKPTVVFSGKDYGNLEYINEFIANNMLKSQVKIIGFVSKSNKEDE